MKFHLVRLAGCALIAKAGLAKNDLQFGYAI
jgi:hypothetical protein